MIDWFKITLNTDNNRFFRYYLSAKYCNMTKYVNYKI